MMAFGNKTAIDETRRQNPSGWRLASAADGKDAARHDFHATQWLPFHHTTYSGFAARSALPNSRLNADVMASSIHLPSYPALACHPLWRCLRSSSSILASRATTRLPPGRPRMALCGHAPTASWLRAAFVPKSTPTRINATSVLARPAYRGSTAAVAHAHLLDGANPANPPWRAAARTPPSPVGRGARNAGQPEHGAAHARCARRRSPVKNEKTSILC